MVMKFFKCPVCGNVIIKCIDSGVVPHCCGQEMEELVPESMDKLIELHLPVVKCKEVKTPECQNLYCTRVYVGEKPHPMSKEHHISFICMETKEGMEMRMLPIDKPADVWFCSAEKPTAVYSYCNLHELWKEEKCKHTDKCSSDN